MTVAVAPARPEATKAINDATPPIICLRVTDPGARTASKRPVQEEEIGIGPSRPAASKSAREGETSCLIAAVMCSWRCVWQARAPAEGGGRRLRRSEATRARLVMPIGAAAMADDISASDDCARGASPQPEGLLSGFVCLAQLRQLAGSLPHASSLHSGSGSLQMIGLQALPAPTLAPRADRASFRRSGRLRVRAQGDAQQDPASPLILPGRRKLEIASRGDLAAGKLGGGGDDLFRLPPGFRGLSPDDLPTQGRSIVEGARGTALQEREPGPSDLDYLSVRRRASLQTLMRIVAASQPPSVASGAGNWDLFTRCQPVFASAVTRRRSSWRFRRAGQGDCSEETPRIKLHLPFISGLA